MTKKDLAKKVKEEHNLTMVAAEAITNLIFEEIKNSLEKGESVDIHNFGKFEISLRSARKGRNPATGAVIDIPAKNSVKFKTGKSLSEKINK